VLRFEDNFDAQWVFQRQVGEFFGQYEDGNLTFYAGKEFENFKLFTHPLKAETKTVLFVP
jgi:hypothetical protein